MREIGSPDRLSAPQVHSSGKVSRRYRPRGLSTPQPSRSASLPRPSSPPASAHILDSPKTPSAREQAPGTPTTPGPGAAPSPQAPHRPFRPSPALEPPPHSQEEAHLCPRRERPLAPAAVRTRSPRGTGKEQKVRSRRTAEAGAATAPSPGGTEAETVRAGVSN